MYHKLLYPQFLKHIIFIKVYIYISCNVFARSHRNFFSELPHKNILGFVDHMESYINLQLCWQRGKAATNKMNIMKRNYLNLYQCFQKYFFLCLQPFRKVKPFLACKPQEGQWADLIDRLQLPANPWISINTICF